MFNICPTPKSKHIVFTGTDGCGKDTLLDIAVNKIEELEYAIFDVELYQKTNGKYPTYRDFQKYDMCDCGFQASHNALLLCRQKAD